MYKLDNAVVECVFGFNGEAERLLLELCVHVEHTGNINMSWFLYDR